MTENELTNIAQKANMALIDVDELNSFLDLTRDVIIYSNNVNAFLGEVKERIFNEQSYYSLLEIQISSEGLITIDEYIFDNGVFLKRPFMNSNIEKDDIEKRRLVVIVNFQRLSVSTQRGLLWDRNGYSSPKLGFIRTKKDVLILAVDASCYKNVPLTVTGRCSNWCIFSNTIE